MTKETIIKSALTFLVQKQIEQGSHGYAMDEEENECSWTEVLEWLNQFDKVTSGIKCDVLDKMKTEIEGMYRVILKGTPKDDWAVRWNDCIDKVLQIIDKYKAEER